MEVAKFVHTLPDHPFQVPLLENGLEASIFNDKYVDDPRQKLNDIISLPFHRARIPTIVFRTIVADMDGNIAHFCIV